MTNWGTFDLTRVGFKLIAAGYVNQLTVETIPKITSWWFQPSHLKNISQIGSFPQVAVKIHKN